jgi:hypothetical protein
MCTEIDHGCDASECSVHKAARLGGVLHHYGSCSWRDVFEHFISNQSQLGKLFFKKGFL